VLSVKQIARRLSISSDAVCDLIRSGALPAIRAAFQAFLSASRVSANVMTPAGAVNTAGA
jgi:excisionase family DNA binding protein